MATTDVKCACSDCKCSVNPESAIQKDGRSYCCEACANGHADRAGCEHDGCHCHG